MSLHDPALVRREYASERGLAGRVAAHRYAEGPDAQDVLFDAVAEARPRRVLEVGCGRGEPAERLSGEPGCEVVALDQSERMVELTRARGVAAVVGDVQALPFEARAFDAAVAAWMLYHVADVERALVEPARVLRPGGRLAVATNGRDHLRELRELLGAPRNPSSFDAEDAEALLGRHFVRVERRTAGGLLRFPDRAAAQAYVDTSMTLVRGRVLPPFEGPLAVTRATAIFVAEAAA